MKMSNYIKNRIKRTKLIKKNDAKNKITKIKKERRFITTFSIIFIIYILLFWTPKGLENSYYSLFLLIAIVLCISSYFIIKNIYKNIIMKINNNVNHTIKSNYTAPIKLDKIFQ